MLLGRHGLVSPNGRLRKVVEEIEAGGGGGAPIVCVQQVRGGKPTLIE